MITIKDIPIAGKFSIIILAFGLLSIYSSMVSTGAMRHIDEGYAGALEHEAAGETDIVKANVRLNRMAGAIAYLVVATSARDRASAIEEIRGSRPILTAFLRKAAQVLPAHAGAIDAVSTRRR
jgi:hypothetical protein